MESIYADPLSGIDLIRPGQIIQLLPRAKYLRWVNFVHELELEVWWTAKVAQGEKQDKAGDIARKPEKKRVYSRLDSQTQEIRLLELHSGREGDPVSCNMIHASISDAKDNVPYTALSYCWGDRNELATIQLSFAARDPSSTEPVDRVEFQIQANLYDALKHMRREQGPPRVVWADAICINQDDDGERSQQVAMMRDIYHLANDVHIWLTKERVTNRPMLDKVLRFVASYGSNPTAFLENPYAEPEAPHGVQDFGVIGYGEVGTLFWHAWFTRVWVLQEVFNARAATVQLGDVCLPWDIVLCIGHCLSRIAQKPRGDMTMPSIFLSLFEIRSEPGKMYVTKRHEQDFLALFVAGLDLGATDPRDKIFALLSLHPDIHELHLSDETRPDYSKNQTSVFSDFTRWWIRKYQSLRILSTIHANVGRTWQNMSSSESPAPLPQDRPSWSLWHVGSTCWASATLGYDRGCKYRASGLTVTEMPLLDTDSAPHILKLNGIRIGSISDARPFPWGTSEERFRSTHMTDAFEKIFDPIGAAKTWTPDGYTSLLTSHDRETLMEDHLIAHQDFAIANEGAIPCVGRCFFSGQGVVGKEIVGLCPHTAEVGDIVVVLVGGNVPHLLREVENEKNEGEVQYRFVGECFVEGYMFGQAIPEWRSGELRMEKFQLI